ncbi:MAG: hypothetical protein LBK77_09420 [Spirochaetaceae bacterium]|jgi:hypothetical protein|nr:hypothetical protein [Spirochaetaceae bacterium]
MKKLLIGALLAFLAAALSAQNQPSVRIVNDTGEVIYFVYISPSESLEWGEDTLGGEILEPGQTVTIPLPSSAGSGNLYDVKLEATYDHYTKYEITASNNTRIVFTVDDLELR